jgi:hypothetical protein
VSLPDIIGLQQGIAGIKKALHGHCSKEEDVAGLLDRKPVHWEG